MISKIQTMRTTSRILFLFVLLALFSQATLAQGRHGRELHRERFRSMRIAFFTEKLELTPEEAEKFWPLFNEFEKNREELIRNSRMRSREFSLQAEELSDQEAEEIINQHIETRKKELQLDIEFHNELKKILPPKKIMQLYITEVQFREYMLRRIRDERGRSKPEPW